jgi:hypothetical protein
MSFILTQLGGSGHWPPFIFISPLNLVGSGLPSKRNFKTMTKVETPIHDNLRELVTWECKEHGVKS